jgi:hypothetical protein
MPVAVDELVVVIFELLNNKLLWFEERLLLETGTER